MKRMLQLLLLFVLMVFVSGCSNKNSKMSGNNSALDKVIQEQMNRVDNSLNEETQNASEDNMEKENTIANDENVIGNINVNEEDTGQDTGISEGEIDYDLTIMSSSMVYALVYQLMINPDAYIGKTIKMSGNYCAIYYEPADKYYHYVIIQDAAACCTQGLEFVWGDGSHVYPEEYPEDETEVEVTGIFETYMEDGDNFLYCRLKDASFQVASDN